MRSRLPSTNLLPTSTGIDGLWITLAIIFFQDERDFIELCHLQRAVGWFHCSECPVNTLLGSLSVYHFLVSVARRVGSCLFFHVLLVKVGPHRIPRISVEYCGVKSLQLCRMDSMMKHHYGGQRPYIYNLPNQEDHQTTSHDGDVASQGDSSFRALMMTMSYVMMTLYDCSDTLIYGCNS